MNTRVLKGDSSSALREQLAEVCREFHLDLRTIQIIYNQREDVIIKIDLTMARPDEPAR